MDSLLFGYPLSTYLWVIGLSSISGTVKYLNEFATVRQGVSKHGNELLYFFRDVLTGVVSGLMAFWLCESFSIKEPLNAVAVTIAGIMGNRAWAEFEGILKAILLRIPTAISTADTKQQLPPYQIDPNNADRPKDDSQNKGTI